MARRFLVGLALLVLLAACALVFWVPRALQGPALRAALEEGAQGAWGLPLAVGAISVSSLPPRVELEALGLGRAGESSFALEVDRVVLYPAWLPLLWRRVVVERISIDDGTLALVEPDGLPPSLRKLRELRLDARRGAEGEPFAVRATGRLESSSRLGSSARLEASGLVRPDETFELAIEIDVESVMEGQLAVEALDPAPAPLQIQLDASLAQGGALRGRGELARDATLAAELELDAVSLAPLAPYVASLQQLDGAASGTVELRGPLVALDHIGAELRVSDAALQAGSLELRGPVAVRATLFGPLLAPVGSFELDATAADLHYAGVYDKRPGQGAVVTGHLVESDTGATDLGQLRVTLRDFEARVDR